jgi:uncharacterized membrane protein YpjA
LGGDWGHLLLFAELGMEAQAFVWVPFFTFQLIFVRVTATPNDALDWWVRAAWLSSTKACSIEQ